MSMSVFEVALEVLNTNDSKQKADITIRAYEAFQRGELSFELPHDRKSVAAPDIPARPLDAVVIKPAKAPSRKSKVSLIHSLAHIESFAIDLSWDIIYRFQPCADPAMPLLPREFTEDWLKVAWDEARHFTIWSNRLEELDCHYGAFPVHNGLWDSAFETRDSLMARLAVVHMVHEARGLDVTPSTLEKFKKGGDEKSAELLTDIYRDEITHVTCGVRWFKYLCEHQPNPIDPISKFHQVVRQYFHGSLKPPFNDVARTEAGFTREWYEPLVAAASTSSSAQSTDDHETSH